MNSNKNQINNQVTTALINGVSGVVKGDSWLKVAFFSLLLPILGIYTSVSDIAPSDEANTEHIQKTIVSNLSANTKINPILEQINKDTGSSLTLFFRYHNGVEGVNFAFLKKSVTNMAKDQSTKLNFSPEKEFEGLPAGSDYEHLAAMHSEKPFIRDAKDHGSSLEDALISEGFETLISQPVFNKQSNLVGYITCGFKEKPKDQSLVLAQMEAHAARLKTVL